MQMRNALLASVCLTFVLAANVDLSLAQGAAALTGVVTSDQEGPMEGVLVTAKKAGSTIAITVVTDKQGRYSFPASRLEPGEYTIKIRAVGYDLDGKGAAEVAADKPATADLKLKKTRNLAGPAHQRRVAPEHAGHAEAEGRVLNCVSCHTVERIVQVDAQRRRIRPGAEAHGHLRQPERADAAAAAQGRAPARGARRYPQPRPSRSAPNFWPRSI